MSENKMTPEQAFFNIGCFLFVIVVVLVFAAVYYTQTETLIGTVESTYVKRTTTDGPDKFFVVVKKHAGGEEVFQNTDSAFYWKWNSADVNARLQPGQKIRIKVVGFRSPILSTFRNVVEIEPLEGK